MYDAACVRVTQTIADLLEVIERFGKSEALLWFCAGVIHQIPAGHKLQNNETKASACRILAIALIENRHYVCVTNLVKDRAFALKLLGEHLLKLGRRSSLQTTVQGFDDNSVSPITIIATIASNEHFRITAGANPASNLIAILEDCSLQV